MSLRPEEDGKTALSEGGSEEKVLRTGLDCVPRILAYTYAKQLWERGIRNQPLCWKLLKKNYAIGYISSSGYFAINRKEVRSEPDHSVELWRPDEIPESVWQCAVQNFTRRSLEDNLLRHLLPLLHDEVANTPHGTLLDLAEKVLVEEKILGWPVRRKGDEVFYFDDQRILKKCSWEEHQAKLQPHEKWKQFLWHSNMIDLNIWNKAVRLFQEGDSLRECIDVFFQTKLFASMVNYTYMERLVTRVEPPVFEREPENENEKTFDRIRIYVNLSHSLHPTREELMQAVRAHRNEIDDAVLTAISSDRRFKRYGVPINVLTLSALTFFNRTLEYIFELKEEA